ncbi:Organic hydroperoxide resistance protein OhrA [Bacillus canaveralius]|uniref:Organic hydroperoxide resistance protein OhrA n=2 Tax=Bacillus canaveralius TaxID=1403243 RepID=A0A2N5GS64_9BACI|nr:MULTISPECIES: organic hydroperoxide resistance protein [Bacillus]PLR85768.1 Organic hydroperoxide resistance protein OhrA [Bacillus sp. V33-4]PLR86400.1 Organic hydroperoxide resistance protein OhrA [Bacillus canaveralius]PLR98633.1 Organic hydroperoxide resistance protein OhrA [Bacillus canaveralius]
MSEPLFTSSATAVGGREGRVESSDGNIKKDLAMPGTPRAKQLPDASNPEQLFAAGYAACFDGALQFMAKKERVSFESEVTANVSLLKDEADDGFKLAVTLQVKGTDIDKAKLEELVHKAHDFCPYSKATRGNIDVTLEVVE